MMGFENSLQFARRMDRIDPLRSFRNKFHRPAVNGKPAIYLAGNSLGLQPRSTKGYLKADLEDWAKLGVEGHLHARRPWVSYHKLTKKPLAAITGARQGEVVAMNQLTVNLHLLMISFYRPTKTRFKILTEAGAFSSDQYVFESQLKFHGIDPGTGLIELSPRPNESILRTEDILKAIHEHGNELALILLGGVQYYTGQFFDIRKITMAGHDVGAVVGFDLAHAIGNVVLNLHRDGVDFAVWCSYKYLNSGPGGIAGVFVHERFAHDDVLPRLTGWWGHDERERFLMKKGFRAMPGADGWQLSNHPVLSAAAHLAALNIFRQAGMRNLRRKSEALTGYLEYILDAIDPDHSLYQVLTPRNPAERGCQLSVFMKKNGRKIFDALTKARVIADWREPDVIRLAPVPLYNTFEEVFRFGQVFSEALSRIDNRSSILKRQSSSGNQERV